MRRIINEYEFCKQRAHILVLENDSLRSGVNILERKDSLSNERIDVLKAKLEIQEDIYREKTQEKDEEIKKRGWIIVGEAVIIGILTIILI